MAIKSSKETTIESFNSIKDGQSGVYRPLKTRFKHLNEICHGGLTKQKIYSLGALSAFGKSHILRQIETDIFDEELNPGAKKDVILCKVDWEMSKEEMILAKVHAKTGKPYDYLMFEKPDEETK
jgi:replicative DNA helicase